jgi:hypothetical protein
MTQQQNYIRTPKIKQFSQLLRNSHKNSLPKKARLASPFANIEKKGIVCSFWRGHGST